MSVKWQNINMAKSHVDVWLYIYFEKSWMIVMCNCGMNVQSSFDVSDCLSIMVQELCKEVALGQCLHSSLWIQIDLLYLIALYLGTVEWCGLNPQFCGYWRIKYISLIIHVTCSVWKSWYWLEVQVDFISFKLKYCVKLYQNWCCNL
jgi:hypothetical protein